MASALATTLHRVTQCCGLFAGGLPSDRGAVDKLVSMMDLDASGTVDLHEFEGFVREQVARGHLIDDCAILLPGGETLTLSHMVANHTRRNLVLTNLKSVLSVLHCSVCCTTHVNM